MRPFFLFSILLQVFIYAYGVKQFMLGRGKGGNLGAPKGVEVETNLPQAQWFQQKLDHANPSNTKFWNQRYFVNDSFYDFNTSKGPVFLMLGGEGPADARWMVKGAWIEYAKTFKALCLLLEHRYYGESNPAGNLSVKNMQHLSSTQALADAAYFINAMNTKYRLSKNVKWVVFGGSYPGSLAAWMRLKYPQIVWAAVSSSGPLLAKLNFMEYFSVVVQALRDKTGSEKCVEELKIAHQQIETMVRLQPAEIEQQFKVCKPFSQANMNDLKTFYSNIANYFADLVQYNEDNRISADVKYKNLTINNVCNMLTTEDNLPAYSKLAKFNTIMLEKANEACLDYSYRNMIDELRNNSWNGEGARQWMFQTCTEFGFYQTSSAEVEVFGRLVDLDYYVQQCQDVFGTRFNKSLISAGVEWTNTAYGALDIDVTRVIFVHGSVDPWHALGIVETEDSDAPAIYIRGTAHCANMYPPSIDDASDLVEARVEIKQYLADWLA